MKPRGANAARLPPPRSILAVVYVARMSLAVAVFVAIVLTWPQATPEITLTATLTLLATSIFTLTSYWHSHLRDRPSSTGFLYAQTVFDALLVSSVVFLTGGAETAFATLYILVICAAAILLPFPGGVLMGLLASTLYIAIILLSGDQGLRVSAFLQIGLFTIVAVVTGYLGARLRETGTQLGEIETELRLLRLDTGDILGTISTGILTVDGEGRLAYINPAAEDLLDLSVNTWIGKIVLEELNRRAPGLGSVIMRSAQTRKPIRRFETDEMPGARLVLGVSTTLMERPADEQPPVTVIFQDITEKKRAEALQRRAERLEAVAELSASLAHEIKNPLASIRSATEQLAGDGIEPEDRAVLAGLVVRESSRLSRLLTEFIDFARVKVIAPEGVAIPDLVRDVVVLLRAHPDAEDRVIDLDEASDEPPLVVRGSADLLHRAVLNLALNAVQWAGSGGRVRIGVNRVQSDILSPALGVADIVEITVADSGPGVPADMTEQIFDPFFTLRPGGTGLGLALVHRAVEAHGGAIFVDRGRLPDYGGAAFTMYLPAADPDISHNRTIPDAA
jgi:two-component system, NtrC family, sensor histidine kinase PilS